MTVQGLTVPNWLLSAVITLGAFAVIVWRMATFYADHTRITSESHYMMCELVSLQPTLGSPDGCRKMGNDE